MAKISFRTRSSKNNAPIKVRIQVGKTDLEKNTGFLVNSKNWKDGKPYSKTENGKTLNVFLKKLESFILDNLNNDLSKGVLINSFWLESKINECFERVEKTDNGILTNHLQSIIDNANTRQIRGKKKLGLSENRIKNLQTFKKLIEAYEKEIKSKINFLDINKAFIDRFKNWLINTKKYSENYSGKALDNLKTVGLDAEKSDIKINPYIKQIESFAESKEDRKIITLSFEDLEKIRITEIPNTKLNNAKKWLLLGCAIGQRAGDLLKITKNDFRYKDGFVYLDIVQEKTGKNITIPIDDKQIINIIENELPKKISSQKLNKYIKEVCKIAGIDEMVEGSKLNPEAKKDNPDTIRKIKGFFPKYELITSHSFRRSFATNFYKKIPTAILIGVTGHSKESMFLQYINKPEDKDANADLFREFYKQMKKKESKEQKKKEKEERKKKENFKLKKVL